MPSSLTLICTCFDSSASWGICCMDWRMVSMALWKLAWSFCCKAWRRASSLAEELALDEEPVSEGLGLSGDSFGMVASAPAPLTSSSPRAVPARMPPEPLVVAETDAGAK